MPSFPLTVTAVVAAMLLGACPLSLTGQVPAKPTPAEKSPSVDPVPAARDDLPPLEISATGARYDMAAMGNPGFDGAASDSWLHRGDQLCRGTQLRPVIVDIDHTAIRGNFISKVQVDPVALAVLNKLETKHGVLFLTANFAFDRIRSFFKRTGYPDSPILSRPRNYWHRDYDDWCRQASRHAICETGFKLDAIEQLRLRCPEPPERMVGLGDKFSDYEAYLRSDVCPLILAGDRVDRANQKALDAGCVADKGGRYAWKADAKALGDRCAFVPEHYQVSWDQVEEVVDGLLSGQVQCGAWGQGTTK